MSGFKICRQDDAITVEATRWNVDFTNVDLFGRSEMQSLMAGSNNNNLYIYNILYEYY